MTPRRYGPLQYVPITRRPKLTWPGGARVALWINPNIEFFGLDDVMPGNQNERVPREHARIPDVRNWGGTGLRQPGRSENPGYSAAGTMRSSSAADRIGKPSIAFEGCPSTPTSGWPTRVIR